MLFLCPERRSPGKQGLARLQLLSFRPRRANSMAMHSIRDKMESVLRRAPKQSSQPQLPKPGKPQDKLESMGYERGEELGRGSFGYAIKVRRKQDGRFYVAKLQKYNQMDVEEQEFCIREIQNMRQLIHPHLVRFRESFRTENHLCIIMDLCDDGDLSQRIFARRDAGDPFPETTVIMWFLQLLSGVDYLHTNKMMHRDIKPANVFMHQNMIKLGDLGLSKQVFTGVSKAGIHTQCGSPLYLAPEVHMGSENGACVYTSSVDIWAMGCTLFEIMMLKRAFGSNNGEGKMETLRAVVEARYGDIRGPWSSQLKDLLMSMLQRAPSNRPSSFEMLSLPLFQPMLLADTDKINSAGLRHLRSMAPPPPPEVGRRHAQRPNSAPDRGPTMPAQTVH